MTVQELFRAGELKGAIQALGAEVRDKPTDNQRRTFLFELLCFAGDYRRAEKHLNILADANANASVGALLCRSAIVAERKRREFFESGRYAEPKPSGGARRRPGKLNGDAFETIEDADGRIGPRLELFIAGEYLWLPFEHIGSVQMDAPRYLRDLLWPAAIVMAGPALQGRDFGEVLLPALYPFSSQHEKDTVKLGRETDWRAENETETPYGQKLLVLDGERVVPFLEIRKLEFEDSSALNENA